MKSIFLTVFIYFSFFANGQIITTVSGNGTASSTGDGNPATTATVNQPFVCAFDKQNNFYFTEVGGNKLRKISNAGIITTIAGGGASLGDNGLATAAQLNNPTGIAIDKNDNIYICDFGNYRIRKINSAGIISTIAGNGSPGFGGDNGPASAAIINSNNLCLDDAGNIFILSNDRVRKITTTGIITTIAGTGVAGNTGDGGAATLAKIQSPRGICSDAFGNIYITQTVESIIRKISTTGIITKIAGNGSITGGDGGPALAAGLATYEVKFDRGGNLYISGYIGNVVRMIDKYGIIHTVAGNGSIGSGGDGGLATVAQLHTPIGIAFDTCNNMYIADRDNHRIRKIAFNPTCIPVGVNATTYTARDLMIYPNPTNDILHIDNLQTPASYKLLNMVGAAVQHGSLHTGSNSLAIQQLPAGVYMLEVCGEDGQRNVSKVIKQ